MQISAVQSPSQMNDQLIVIRKKYAASINLIEIKKTKAKK